MRVKIQNSDELRSELTRLRMERAQYEHEFQMITEKVKDKLSIPAKIFNKIGDIFNSLFGSDETNHSPKEEMDWVTNISRVGIPVFLNKMFFPKSGLLMKSIVALLSQKAAKNVNKETVSDLINKISDWIRSSKQKRRREPVLQDYGIPPDSETF